MQSPQNRPHDAGRLWRLGQRRVFYPISAILGISLVFTTVLPAQGIAETNQQYINQYKQQIKAKDEAVQQLQAHAQQVQAQLSDVRGKERTLANEITSLDRQIESLDLEIQITQGRIDEANLHIEELKLEIAQREKDIAVGEERVGATLRTMQFFEEGVDPVELVFAARPFSEIFDTLRSAEVLDATLAETLQEIKTAKEQLEQAKQQSEQEKTDAEKLHAELIVKQALLSGQQDEREGLLSATKHEEANYQKLLKDIQAQQQAAQREILTLEAQLRYAIDPSSLPGKGVLSWPVAIVRITQGYGPTTETGFINDTYQFHNGIDFGASAQGVIGDPVFAPASGTVVGVGNDGRYAYGRWVTIDHHNGITTLYGHLSLQDVSVGQDVQRGEIIGRMGSTGFSSGPHLHFTVYATETFRIEQRPYGLLPLGGSINPMNFLQ